MRAALSSIDKPVILEKDIFASRINPESWKRQAPKRAQHFVAVLKTVLIGIPHGVARAVDEGLIAIDEPITIRIYETRRLKTVGEDCLSAARVREQ